MKIFNTNINDQKPPSYEILLELLIALNPNIKEAEIVKEIKKLGIYDVPTTIANSKKGKSIDSSNVRDADNIQ